MRRNTFLRWPVAPAALLLAALAGCGGVKVRAIDTVPKPLVDELPLRAGTYYSNEFKTYTAKEDRWNTHWTVSLGPAQLTYSERLAKAMFASVLPVADLSKPPPVDLILEPRVEEYSFITPRDAGADLYAVTIKYRVNVYDGAARLIDSLIFTGYGTEVAANLSSSAPLATATSKAMRDAAAKFASEFADQPVIQKLARHEAVEPMPVSGQAAPGAVAEVKLPAGPAPTAKTVPTGAAPAKATATPAGGVPAAAPEAAPPATNPTAPSTPPTDAPAAAGEAAPSASPSTAQPTSPPATPPAAPLTPRPPLRTLRSGFRG